MSNTIQIRQAVLSDIENLKRLFQETVCFVNAKDYSADEIADWASCGEDTEHLTDLVNNLHFIVAEKKDEIVGMASISKDGYLHSMFVHKDFQRQGVATILYEKIENHAQLNGVSRIWSEVSITAKGFFEKQGFFVEKEQKRKANKLYLTNYVMVKNL